MRVGEYGIRLPAQPQPALPGTKTQTQGTLFGTGRLFVQEETAKHIVLYSKGGSVYMDRASGTRYQPSKFYVFTKVREEPYTERERLIIATKLLEIDARGRTTTVALSQEEA